GIPLVRHRRIDQNAKANEEHQAEQDAGNLFLHPLVPPLMSFTAAFLSLSLPFPVRKVSDKGSRYSKPRSYPEQVIGMKAGSEQGVCLFLFYLFRHVRHTVSPHQKTVTVDPVRSTGEQRHQIFSFLYRKA